MQAEIQVISPLVPVRQMRFLRFCRQHVNGAWVVVDVSIDNISEGVGSQTFSPCRRLPSGCILQDMPNGCSKVIADIVICNFYFFKYFVLFIKQIMCITLVFQYFSLHAPARLLSKLYIFEYLFMVKLMYIFSVILVLYCQVIF